MNLLMGCNDLFGSLIIEGRAFIACLDQILSPSIVIYGNSRHLRLDEVR